MYDFVIVGAGIAGLNMARLLLEQKKYNICIIEKSNRIGGLIDTKHLSIFTCKNKPLKNKNKTCKKSSKKIKYEAGAAVVYSHQKNMCNLLSKYNIKTRCLPADHKVIENSHYKDFWDGKPRKNPLSKKSTIKFFNLLKKLFAFMDQKGKSYCRKFNNYFAKPFIMIMIYLPPAVLHYNAQMNSCY